MGCFGGGGTTVVAPPTPEPTPEELAIQREILSIMQEDRVPTENELKIEEYTLQLIEDQISALPINQEYREMALEMARMQFDEYTSPAAEARRATEKEYWEFRLEGIQKAKELGEITGDLSDQEMAALDTMYGTAQANLETSLQRGVDNILPSVVAEMVDRGVLQGDIGAKAIADVYERKAELLSEGTLSLEGQKASSILAMGEAQKNRQLQLQQLLQSGLISGEQADQLYAQNAWGAVGGQGALAQQSMLSAQQFASGLSQQWEQSKLNAGIAQWGQMAGMRGAEADRALQAAIATAEAESAASASKWGALGSVGGMLGMAGISKWG